MNLKFQLTKAFVLTLLCLIGFGFIAFSVSANKIVHFDSHIISFVQGFETPKLTAVMEFFTFLGEAKPILTLTLLSLLILYKVLKHRYELILFIASSIGSFLINRSLKFFFHRARPDLHRLIEIGGYSFPSGHAMSSFTFFGTLTFLLWRHIASSFGRAVLILFSTFMILAIGMSRIYLGVHYPSDVISGYLASAFWLAVLVFFFQRYRERNK